MDDAVLMTTIAKWASDISSIEAGQTQDLLRCIFTVCQLGLPCVTSPQGMRSIGPYVSAEFAEIVKVRNKLAKLLGFQDFYDYKVTSPAVTVRVVLSCCQCLLVMLLKTAPVTCPVSCCTVAGNSSRRFWQGSAV